MGRVYALNGIGLTNTSGGTVLDGVGLLGTTNFNFGGTDFVNSRSTVSSTAGSGATDIPNTSLTYINTRPTRVLCLAQADISLGGYAGGENLIGVLQWNFAGTWWPQMARLGAVKNGTFSVSHEVTVFGQKLVTFAAGTNTIKLQYYVSSGNGTQYVAVVNTSVTYLELGK